MALMMEMMIIMKIVIEKVQRCLVTMMANQPPMKWMPMMTAADAAIMIPVSKQWL